MRRRRSWGAEGAPHPTLPALLSESVAATAAKDTHSRQSHPKPTPQLLPFPFCLLPSATFGNLEFARGLFCVECFSSLLFGFVHCIAWAGTVLAVGPADILGMAVMEAGMVARALGMVKLPLFSKFILVFLEAMSNFGTHTHTHRLAHAHAHTHTHTHIHTHTRTLPRPNTSTPSPTNSL